MNKKILVITVALMAVAMLGTPVFAAEKAPAVLTIRTAAVQNTLPEEAWTTNGGITHQQGIIRTVPLESTVMAGTPPAPTIVKNVVLKINNVPIYGIIYAEVDTMTNTKTGMTINHYHKWIITFPVQTGVPVEGVFEGTNIWVLEPLPGATPPVSVEGHAVLQGSGGFEGQTLKIAVDFPPSMGWTGYLLTR